MTFLRIKAAHSYICCQLKGATPRPLSAVAFSFFTFCLPLVCAPRFLLRRVSSSAAASGLSGGAESSLSSVSAGGNAGEMVRKACCAAARLGRAARASTMWAVSLEMREVRIVMYLVVIELLY